MGPRGPVLPRVIKFREFWAKLFIWSICEHFETCYVLIQVENGIVDLPWDVKSHNEVREYHLGCLKWGFGCAWSPGFNSIEISTDGQPNGFYAKTKLPNYFLDSFRVIISQIPAATVVKFPLKNKTRPLHDRHSFIPNPRYPTSSENCSGRHIIEQHLHSSYFVRCSKLLGTTKSNY